ncbi:MAG: hypothetical protein L0Y56_21930 [Nitrospira sp.]|nr:hypothetical protein [Nitrospira sp.]
MKVMISAEDNEKSVLSITLTFKEQEEGLAVARMLETFARNWWLSIQDEQARRSLGQNSSLENSPRPQVFGQASHQRTSETRPELH